MSDFIPGRMYRYVNEFGAGPFFYFNGVYEAASKESLINARGEIQEVLAKDKFILTTGTSAELKVPSDNYRFKVSSEKAIDLAEVYKCLSRKQPLAVVKRSDGLHTVVVHNSILEKAAHIAEETADRFEEAMAPYEVATWLPLDARVLSPLVAAVKAVRNAQYTKRKELECQVDLVKVL